MKMALLIVCGLLGLLCLCLAWLHAAPVLEYNRAMTADFERRFSEAEKSGYDSARSLSDLDLRPYGFHHWVDESSVRPFPLPADISYYAGPSVWSKRVLTLKKGTVVFADVNPNNSNGYGFSGFPASRRGWQYALPLLPVGENARFDPDAFAAMTQADCLYVQTRDLQTAAEAFYRECSDDAEVNWYMNAVAYTHAATWGILAGDGVGVAFPEPIALQQAFRREGYYVEKRGDTYLSNAESYALLSVLYMDGLLEIRGHYLSPNFLLPTVDGTTALLLAAGGAFLLTFCVLLYCAARGKIRSRGA